MAWEKANLMFPEGHTIVNDDVNIEELSQYDKVIVPRFHFARKMLTRKDILEWTADNNYIIHVLYNVNDYNNRPEIDSCLSVFGNKMVIDYYQRDQFKKRRYSGEVQRAGFNYTGL